MRVDAVVRAEDVLHVHHHRERGQRPQGWLDLRAVGGVRQNLLIHLVVRRHRGVGKTRARGRAPVRRIPRRIRRLANHRVEEQISMRHRHGRQHVCLERRRAENRRVRDRQRARVNQPVRARRLAAIPRVADGRARQRRVQQQGEGSVEEAPAHIEMRHRHHARDGAVPIRCPRRRRDEIFQQAAAIGAVGIIIALLRILRRKLRQRHARRIRIEQRQVIPEWIQPEIRMKPLPAPRRLPVLL